MFTILELDEILHHRRVSPQACPFHMNSLQGASIKRSYALG